MAQLHEIASQSLVIGGDFNTTGLDRALDELQPQLADAFAGSGFGWGATGTNDWPLFRVDQIWTNTGLISVRVLAEKTDCSDHHFAVRCPRWRVKQQRTREWVPDREQEG